MDQGIDNEALQFQTRLENIAALPRFNELLDLTIETCLNDPEAYRTALKAVEAKRVASAESDLLAELGHWGLRAALEFSQNASGYRGPDDSSPDVILHDLLWEPRLLPGSPDRAVQNKIEAFGKALLDEAFLCLGEDAPDQVSAFQNAETEEEQVEIVEWLIGRIVDIRDGKRPRSQASAQSPAIEEEIIIDDLPRDFGVRTVPYSGPPRSASEIREVQVVDLRDTDMDERYFYHPARLSPRLMGVYPETRLKPTCLGISILAAAFFEKASVPYMHAGMAITATEAGRISQVTMINLIRGFSRQMQINIPDGVEAKFTEIEASIKKTLTVERGFHAGVLAQLKSGEWTLVDPNYESNMIYHEVESEITQGYYDLLRVMDELVAGAEVMVGSSSSRVTFVHGDHMRHNLEGGFVPATDSIFSDQPGSTLDRIKAYLLAFVAESEDIDHVTDVMMEGTRQNKAQYVDEVLENIIFDYVFPDAKKRDLTASLARFASDREYRRRRVEDLIMAPFYFVLRLQADLLNSFHEPVNRAPMPNPLAMEAGMPHYRIGACVLSDFAVYTGDELPLSFWLAHWPSHIAMADHIPSPTDERQTIFMKRMAQIIRSGTLWYYGAYDMIIKLLEQKESEGGSHGQR